MGASYAHGVRKRDGIIGGAIMFYPSEWDHMHVGESITWKQKEDGREVKVDRTQEGWIVYGARGRVKIYHSNGFVTQHKNLTREKL